MRAIRTSHSSEEKLDSVNNRLGLNDERLLQKIIEQRHDSVLEHVTYTFLIEGISRALLQELARHRHVSMTVQSTRFTLKKLMRNAETLIDMIVFPEGVDAAEFYREIAGILEKLKHCTWGNDACKYLLPEAFKTKLVLTTNARELAWIIKLRSQPNVLWEFRRLVQKLYEEVRKVHPQMWSMIMQREAVVV